MPRVKGGPRARAKHKKIISHAKGYKGTRSKLFRRANEAVLRSNEKAFQGRKLRKRDFRKLWITRISAALSTKETNYSTFTNNLKNKNIILNRKMLSEIAIHDNEAFEKILSESAK